MYCDPFRLNSSVKATTNYKETIYIQLNRDCFCIVETDIYQNAVIHCSFCFLCTGFIFVLD